MPSPPAMLWATLQKSMSSDKGRKVQDMVALLSEVQQNGPSIPAVILHASQTGPLSKGRHQLLQNGPPESAQGCDWQFPTKDPVSFENEKLQSFQQPGHPQVCSGLSECHYFH